MLYNTTYDRDRNIEEKKKVVQVKLDTWKKLWNLKTRLEKSSLDDVILEAIGIYEIILDLAETYRMDPLHLTKDMVILYSEYLERKWIKEERRGL